MTVEAINHMIDEVGNGKTIFYDFYTKQQKQMDPTKEFTGLFFFRGEPGAPFAIVCPGGGFVYVGSLHEGFPHALELSKKGYNAFVLKYRLGSELRATKDLATAIFYIFENKDMLEISTEDYSLWGSSAGARMVANIGSYGVAGFGGRDLPKPCTVVMAYTGHSDFSENDPPTFVIVGENDLIANVSTVENRVAAMKKAGVEVDYRKYKNLGHGFGLGVGTGAEGWIEHAVQFWENHLSRK
jgi:acetyl esterase/lipase